MHASFDVSIALSVEATQRIAWAPLSEVCDRFVEALRACSIPLFATRGQAGSLQGSVQWTVLHFVAFSLRTR